ncbi:hypothetical protein GGR28_002985 [Lewinella aquimaris]|uniref:Uncharacterized protein n=1 Tax=Neolewinella aquimaris TaxID=1835722 RepID=A0A840E5A1_9BACT|nr:hypothetical protein [Neolewinella aquimaris]MBB4080351.1 hypothetical protein [Neolewinella aquimaris]
MRQNPLSFLFVLSLIVVLPNLGAAQIAEEIVDTLGPHDSHTELVAEVKRIRKLTSRGPHRKNPLAGGRLRTLNRAARVKQLPTTYTQLTERAFGSRLRVRTSDRLVPQKKVPRAYGPKYKNRGARSQFGFGRG